MSGGGQWRLSFEKQRVWYRTLRFRDGIVVGCLQ